MPNHLVQARIHKAAKEAAVAMPTGITGHDMTAARRKNLRGRIRFDNRQGTWCAAPGQVYPPDGLRL